MTCDRMHKGVSVGAVFITCLLLWLVTACKAVGPDYVPPELAAPPGWNAELSGGLSSAAADPELLGRWWTAFQDESLSRLELRALRDSLDLKGARGRVREARALRGVSRAGFFPTLDAGASVVGFRESDNAGRPGEGELYSAGFDAGWELDIFGGVRRSVEAAQATLEASQAGLQDVLVSLAAEIALNYLELRTLQARIAVARANIEVQENAYELNRLRFEAGVAGELAVAQSKYNLERTRSLLPTFESGLIAAENRLAVLVGVAPGELEDDLMSPQPIPVPPPAVAIGIPAEVLRRRPDIRQAERNLAAQTARIGIATAELYPRFSLAGSIGLESLDAGDWLDWDSRTWLIGPFVSWRLFDGGAIRRSIEVQDARQEQALAAYQKTVLSAHAEVETVLTAYAREQLRRRYVTDAAAAARRALEVADDQYKAGLVDYTAVLDAQRSLQSLQDDLAVSNGNVAANMVRLYKALGGGWSTPGDDAAAFDRSRR